MSFGDDFYRMLTFQPVRRPNVTKMPDDFTHAKGHDCERTENVLDNYRHRTLVAEAQLAAIKLALEDHRLGENTWNSALWALRDIRKIVDG